jgi:beta-glucosidase
MTSSGRHASAETRPECYTAGEPQARHFPPGFLWGAATSSHQVEGDNRWSDWWEYEQSGRLPQRSGDACRHYELYERDFDLARSWGHNAHRCSIEWSRIEPAEGMWNQDAVAHYRSVIRALLERGLEPVITLHHFTNPVWFTRAGGWSRQDSASVFARYVGFVAEQLGKDVRYWLTINEPTVYILQGYINGEWPPLLKASWIKAMIAFKNLARAHVLAYRRLHQVCRDAQVGFSHSAPVVMPCNAQRKRDCIAALFRDFILNRAFFLLIGASFRNREGTARCLDYIGINYYTRAVIRSVGWGARALLGQACHLDHHSDRGAMSDTGWEVYPVGLRVALKKFSRYGIPLLVTENGIATDDETLRSEFIIEHLQSLAEARQGGVNVIGYLYWSLMDNYEWTLGTAPHFGLAAVDPLTQERQPRPCVEVMKNICRENRLPG